MEFKIKPVGFVRSDRKDAADDGWEKINSYVELSGEYADGSIEGLSDFSHVEVIFYFHKADPGLIKVNPEHPRENPAWPKVGIFAQRKKTRPNLLGTTICRIVRIEGKKIYLKNLDAIDGTPVIDLKPVFRQFLPGGMNEIKQPGWVDELMRNYW